MLFQLFLRLKHHFLLRHHCLRLKFPASPACPGLAILAILVILVLLVVLGTEHKVPLDKNFHGLFTKQEFFPVYAFTTYTEAKCK